MTDDLTCPACPASLSRVAVPDGVTVACWNCWEAEMVVSDGD